MLKIPCTADTARERLREKLFSVIRRPRNIAARQSPAPLVSTFKRGVSILQMFVRSFPSVDIRGDEGVAKDVQIAISGPRSVSFCNA